MSLLGSAYQNIYEALCGRHPNVQPWHFQWLFLRGAHSWQRKQMQLLSGRVLDVGCGDKPYADWLPSSPPEEYVGLDIAPGEGVDVVVAPGEHWPFEDQSFDGVLFTQVLEHLENRHHVLGEIRRVLKPGGRLVVTVPFLFPVHGEPNDYARFTGEGIRALFEDGYEIHEIITTGGVGTVLASLLLTWVENSMNANLVTRLLKGLLLPFWLVLSILVNGFGLLLDLVDRSGTHYANVCLLAGKR